MNEDKVNQEGSFDEGPDYAKDSGEDHANDAPSGKEALTPADTELPDDQASIQTDNS